MKKLLDSKFLFILALSIIVLIILGIGAFYLFDDSDATFVRDGYVLNPLSAKSEKYFFDENASYKENLNQMVVFNDVDKNEVRVLRDSFLHYMDGSLSFLKNGAILDLDSIKGTEAVKFYNITNKSIIDRRGNAYVIETDGNDIGLKNFIGRINDNKYIIVGALEAKIPGNEKNIGGDYFEVVYTDEGIVNIENKDIKYQVAAQGSYIYAGDIVIDLGDKKITKNGDDIMSITAITINGNENIEIMPKTPDETENNLGEGDGTGDGTDDGQGGVGDDGDVKEEVQVKELQVLLKDYDSDSTSITVSFDVENAREDDSLMLKVTDLATGRTVNEVMGIENKRDIPITLLSPESKYLFTVINERNQNKYFQKIFTTKSFGIGLEKSYVTSNEIGYKINIDAGGNLQDAKLTLKKYNEETSELDDVASYQLKDLIDMTEGEHDGIIFTGLDSDTIYTAVLDSFSVASTNFNDIYNVTLTSMTLKDTPIFGDMQKEVTTNSFKLYLDSVEDPDNSITSYTYTIYKASDTEFAEPVIPKIVKADASPVEVKIGSGANELDEGINYVYKVAIEYNDNEKYIEYMMDGSINLFKGKDPYVVIEAGDMLSYDKFEAEIYLYDNSCLIDVPSKCDVSAYAPNESIKVMVYERGVMQNEVFLREYTGEDLKFEEADENGTYKANLIVDNLSRGTTYAIYVMAERNDRPNEGFKPVLGTDENNIFKTKYLASFKAVWENEAGNEEKPIEAKVKLEGIPNDKAVSPEESIGIVKAVVFKLYEGEFNNNIADQRFIASSKPIINSDSFNIPDAFFNNQYSLTLYDTFGLTLSDLEDITDNEDGKLSAYYTIVMDAYYDYEMIEKNSVTISDKWNPYHINPELRNDILNDPTLTIDPIKKVKNDYYDNSLTAGLVVGYTLNADFDEDSFARKGWVPQSINFYVYDANGNRVQFYIADNNTLRLVPYYSDSLGDKGYYVLNIYMDYGTKQGNVMTRGNKYYVGYEVIYTIEGENDIPPYPMNDNPDVPVRTGLYKSIDDEVTEKALKDQPKVKYAYIEETTEDGKVTYKYEITDIDGALLKSGNDNYIYYNINSEYKGQLKLTKGESVRANGVVTADIPVYTGEVTLTDLTQGDGYTLYYQAQLDNNALAVQKTIGKDNRLFEGYYKSTDYNFKFEVSPNLTDVEEVKNNKVTVKILAEEEMLSRILSYKITFSTPGVDDVVKEPWELTTCPNALEGETPRCYQVEYIELKRAGMKTEGSNTKLITVSVQAIYDNGLTGYGYESKVGSEYPYMIMQENSIVGAVGKYHIINNRMLRKSTPGYPNGYYTFSINDGWLTYNSMYNTNDTGLYELVLSSDGRGVSSGVMNPKMVSSEMMSSDNDKNKFSFSSITPMIKTDGKVSLINGAKIYLSLSGADTNDVCVENSSNSCTTRNGDRYLYIDIWENEEDADDNTKIPIDTIKVKLNNGDNINGGYNTADKISYLLHDKTYYYTVYTYLNNNGIKKKTRLFDDDLKDRALVYSFDTKKLLDIFDENKLLVNVIPNNDGAYNDKLLSTSVTLNKYDEDIPFNFDLSYVLCDMDAETCDLDNNLLKKTINDSDSETSVVNGEGNIEITDLFDITSMDLEFGKDYLMRFYMTYRTYNDQKQVIDKMVLAYSKDVLGNVYMAKPQFVVARTADFVNNDYVIDLTIDLTDNDRVLIDGKYYVELTDVDGNLVGNLQLMDNEGIYTIVASDSYNEYAIEAIDHRTLRIGGLTSDTLYTVKVFSDAYMNNADLENKTVRVASGEEGTGHRVYSSNNYGVAFGKSILYTFAASNDENTIVANFGYGSHLKGNAKIKSVTYTIKRDGSSLPPYSKTLLISDEISFEQYANTDNLIMRFNIDENEFRIIRGDQYIFTTSYTVYDEVNDQDVVIDYTIYPTLSGKVANYNANNG